MHGHTIPWEKSVWFSDVDDTLVNTSSLTAQASEGVRKVLLPHLGETIATKVQKHFVEMYTLMLLGLRNKTDAEWEDYPKEKKAFARLWKQVSDCQQEIIQKYGSPKKFSREVFIKLALEREGKKVSPEVIYEAADYYWLLLSEQVEVLPGVMELLQEIHNHNRPLYLLTSSDARLTLKDTGQFVYEPKYSEHFKRERIQLLRQKGIDFTLVSIGDPEDKPHLDFFQKGVRLAEADLGRRPAQERLGFGLGVFYQEGKTFEVINEHTVTTGNLSDVTTLLV